MVVSSTELKRLAATKLPFFEEHVRGAGRPVDGEQGSVEVPDDLFAILVRRYSSPSPTSLPSAAAMVKNAATALRDELMARIDGRPEIEMEEVDRRLEICHSCDFFVESQGRCAKCGCFMNFKTKLRSQHCPEGKW